MGGGRGARPGDLQQRRHRVRRRPPRGPDRADHPRRRPAGRRRGDPRGDPGIHVRPREDVRLRARARLHAAAEGQHRAGRPHRHARRRSPTTRWSSCSPVHEEIGPEDYWRRVEEVVGSAGRRPPGPRSAPSWRSAPRASPRPPRWRRWSPSSAPRPDEVIAFGDMPNDLPLLEWAGTSYAMANAPPDGDRAGRPHGAPQRRGRRRRCAQSGVRTVGRVTRMSSRLPAAVLARACARSWPACSWSAAWCWPCRRRPRRAPASRPTPSARRPARTPSSSARSTGSPRSTSSSRWP